jgi:protein dispatched 3
VANSTQNIFIILTCIFRDVRVLYGGNEVFDLQVTKTFWNDLHLALFAVAAIIVLMLVLTSFSVWLTTFGLLTIILSFPLAFFFYRVVFEVVSLGILNGVAAFVIVGIGQYLSFSTAY